MTPAAAFSAQQAADAANAPLAVEQERSGAIYEGGVEAFWRSIGDTTAADLIAGIPSGTLGAAAQGAYEGDPLSRTSAINLDNLGVALDILEMCNDYRSAAGLSPPLVDSYLMAVSVGSADYADDYFGNSAAGNYSHQVARDNNVGENLAWNYSVDVDYAGATSNGWMAEWVTKAAEAGLMTGMKNADGTFTGEFAPAVPLTRAQAVVVLYRAMTGASDDEPVVENATPFTDLAPDPTYYNKAVNWAYLEGVVTGYDGTTEFRPDAAISRQELALMVWRAAGSPEAADATAYASCVDCGTEWADATPALTWTAEQGILSGSVELDGTYLDPSVSALRGQAAKVFVTSVPFLAASAE